MVIITIAICVFSALLLLFFFLSLQEKFRPEDYGRHLLYSTREAELNVCVI